MTHDPVEGLRALIARGVATQLPDAEFDDLALAVARYQLEGNEAYRSFGRLRGVRADSLGHWTEAPMVPTRAFKTARLTVGDPALAEAVFRTSGTTRGRDRRGEHHVRDLSIYEAALLPNFAKYMLPDGASLPVIALVPDPAVQPDSSLGHMVDVAARRLCSDGGRYFFHDDRGLDLVGLDEYVQALVGSGRPVLVAGTAFALVRWTDALAAAGRSHTLERGSRVLETGGFKGRSRTVERQELYQAIEDRLGVPHRRIVNEYGMTELLSQFYEPVLTAQSDGESAALADRLLEGPPWVRTRILDPETLEPLPQGSVGLLHHMDLANVHSVSSVLTEDLGVQGEGGFRVLGRATESEPRGCSLAMEDFLAATSSPG